MRYELSEMYTQTARSWAIQNRLGLLATEDLEDILAEANPPLLYTHTLGAISSHNFGLDLEQVLFSITHRQ